LTSEDHLKQHDAAIAVIWMLFEKWPACLAMYERARRPLKIGIHRDILAALDGAMTLQGFGRGCAITPEISGT
jgi:sRNA-binding protein